MPGSQRQVLPLARRPRWQLRGSALALGGGSASPPSARGAGATQLRGRCAAGGRSSKRAALDRGWGQCFVRGTGAGGTQGPARNSKPEPRSTARPGRSPSARDSKEAPWRRGPLAGGLRSPGRTRRLLDRRIRRVCVSGATALPLFQSSFQYERIRAASTVPNSSEIGRIGPTWTGPGEPEGRGVRIPPETGDRDNGHPRRADRDACSRPEGGVSRESPQTARVPTGIGPMNGGIGPTSASESQSRMLLLAGGVAIMPIHPRLSEIS